MDIIRVKTHSRTELLDITGEMQEAINKKGLTDGAVIAYVPHTTAGIIVNEGADPAVKRDILAVLNMVIPDNFDYRHMEGNSPAHIKSSLTGSSVQVIVTSGKLAMGTWQRIFFCEFDGPRNRKVWIQTLKEA